MAHTLAQAMSSMFDLEVWDGNPPGFIRVVMLNNIDNLSTVNIYIYIYIYIYSVSKKSTYIRFVWLSETISFKKIIMVLVETDHPTPLDDCVVMKRAYVFYVESGEQRPPPPPPPPNFKMTLPTANGAGLQLSPLPSAY